MKKAAKQREPDEAIHVRDALVNKLVGELNQVLEPASDYYNKDQFVEAYPLFLQASERCQTIINSCKKRSKLMYIPSFQKKLSSISYDLGRCAFEFPEKDAAVRHLLEALQGGVNKSAELLAIIHINTDKYSEAIQFLLMHDTYKKFNVAAIYNVAMVLTSGKFGVEINPSLSLKFLLSLEKRFKGDSALMKVITEAEFYERIAQVYAVLKNPKSELTWRLKAVALNCPMSLHNYATMLSNGEATEKNPELALEYHLKAAQLGHVAAMVDAGVMLFGGDEVKQNLTMAEYWLTKAADEHDNVLAMANLASLIITHKHDELPLHQERIEKYCSRGELENNRVAKNCRASLLFYDCLEKEQPFDEVIELFQELALTGFGVAQFNLAVTLHVFDKGSPATAIYWYLEAIRNGFDEAKVNLIMLIYSLAKKMQDQPHELSSLYRSTLVRYQRMLRKNEYETDSYFVLLKEFSQELDKGLNGEISELFKDIFPDISVKLHQQIISISEQTTRVANSDDLETEEKIKIILEFTLTSAMSNRNRTAALRDIGRIVAWERHGAKALINNQDLVLEILQKISQSALDSEGFVDLCIAIAKMKGHPESRLFKPFYDILLRHLQKTRGTVWMSASGITTVLNSIGDLAVTHPLVDALVQACLENFAAVQAAFKPYQLLRSLQGLCVSHACVDLDTVKSASGRLIVEITTRLASINPNCFSPIDLHQGYLSIQYISKNRVIASDVTVAFFGNFKRPFERLLTWLHANKANNVHTSRSQKQLADFFRRYRRDVEEEVLRSGLFVDIFLRDNSKVVEFDGPHHFLNTLPDEELPKIRRCKDQFHDKILGSTQVLRLVYDELDQVQDDEARLQFLQKKCLPYGIGLEVLDNRAGVAARAELSSAYHFTVKNDSL